jgi:acetylornithine deacetylase
MIRAVGLTDREREIIDEIERRRDDLVELTADLVGFDTTSRNVGDPARDEAKLQAYLAERLEAAGAGIDLFEPDAHAMAGKPLVPPGLDFAGRPQLAARFTGAGGGKSLLLNGHIDAVPYEPVDAWTSHPLKAEVRDGRLHGRGSCDMKGGVAAMTFAAEVLAAKGVTLAGDLIVATNTDEESSGAGGMALVERGIRADAGIVTEPTNFTVWVACRGSEYGTIVVPGRPGHAEVAQAHWRQGGAVNAIEKTGVVLDALRRLREEWRGRSDLSHPYLSAPDVVPTMISAGEWAVTYPADCRLSVACMFLPQQADEGGWGRGVRREVDEWLARAAVTDPWLAENPPRVEWWPNGVMSMEIPEDEPVVDTMLGATDAIGRPGRLSGLDSWYDGATFTLLAGTPSVAFGPSGFDPTGRDVAHTIDEYVPVDDLVACAQALAVAAMRYCTEVA